MSSFGRSLHRLGAYRELAPPADLARTLDVAWLHEAPPQRVDAYPGYLVVQEPAVSLCFTCRRDVHGRVVDPRLLLIGPIRVSRTYLPLPAQRMEAVRIHPEWCRRILGVDPRDHTDALDDYATVRPHRGRALLDLLSTTLSPEESLRHLLGFVGEQAHRCMADGTSTLVHRGLQRVRTSPRPDRLRQVAEGLGITTRHFRRVVVETSGLAPRTYARLERLRGLLRDADATDRPQWSDLALLHGYADQPHLSREARDLTGLPPRRLHAERRREPSPAGR